MSFDAALKSAQALVAARSSKHILIRGNPLGEAMHYAMTGGKAFRAFLVLESCAIYDVPLPRAERAAMAVECIHAYSLIHDDLPCMDDDDMRRGRPTVHKKWDEAVAVLAGDALQAKAFDYLGHPNMGDHALDAVHHLARAAGRSGMVGGQMMDILAESDDQALSLEHITQLQRRKTGALISWSATAGPTLAGTHSEGLSAYAQAIGLAFQIADDILDVEGDEAETGKRVGKDADAGKATFVSHLGLEGAKARAKSLVTDAETALLPYGDAAQTLKDAARFVIARKS